mgnify:CR=1 FL=1
MTGSYLGGSTIIKPPKKSKGWYARQRRREKYNNEKNNEEIKHAKHMQNLAANWEPEYTLIKKGDIDEN